MPPWLAVGEKGGSQLTIHVQPGASNNEFSGVHGDALKLRIRARAVEGAANTALTGYLAKQLGLTKRDVVLIRGEKSRRKIVWTALPPDHIARIITP